MKVESTELKEYLISGALLHMLKTNTGGTAPHIWIVRKSTGELTHRFTYDVTGDQHMQDAIGGIKAPFYTLEGEKIFAHEQDAVMQ